MDTPADSWRNAYSGRDGNVVLSSQELGLGVGIAFLKSVLRFWPFPRLEQGSSNKCKLRTDSYQASAIQHEK